MFQRTKNFIRLYKFLQNVEEMCSTKLTSEDVNNISLLYTDERYKSLVKLHNNIIMDLQNKGFREMQLLEEFMGVKWARQVLLLLQTEVKNKYFQSIKIPDAKTTPTPENLESVPDGIVR